MWLVVSCGDRPISALTLSKFYWNMISEDYHNKDIPINLKTHTGFYLWIQILTHCDIPENNVSRMILRRPSLQTSKHTHWTPNPLLPIFLHDPKKWDMVPTPNSSLEIWGVLNVRIHLSKQQYHIYACLVFILGKIQEKYEDVHCPRRFLLISSIEWEMPWYKNEKTCN